MILVRCVLLSFSLLASSGAIPFLNDDEDGMHPRLNQDTDYSFQRSAAENNQAYWEQIGYKIVEEHLEQLMNVYTAKNVIFFLGDGMSLATLAAARAYMGQMEGRPGEESKLSFEKFPVTGLSKTYCVDETVADSACSATAYLCGVKGNSGTIGVNGWVNYKNCTAMANEKNHAHSLAKKFLDNGRSAGLVTTTRVTHASPAGVYAHVAKRGWEHNKVLEDDCGTSTPNKDIAYQLINHDVGKKLKVIMGGGRREFIPTTQTDEEGGKGKRTDGKNLINSWKDLKKNTTHEYVWNKKQLLAVKDSTEYLLGLFENDHCKYHLETDENEPSFEEMVEKAIKILSKDKKGYFLFAEGGRIDHAHHSNYAQMALDETVEFSKAIAKAVAITSRKDTLIVVTSDHSHVMTLNGYPLRGRDILRDTGSKADDGKRYTTLSYANGPGYRADTQDGRYDPSKDSNLGKPKYRYPAMVPLSSETHAGEDVAVFALGPFQQLFTGNYEQSAIPYLISYAACIDSKNNACTKNSGR